MSQNLPSESAVPKNNRLYRFGPFSLQVSERRLMRDGKVIALPNKLFDLLLALVESGGRLRTREELVETIWPRTIVEEHSLTSRVSALRKALGDDDTPARYIETVRGTGYRFIAAVSAEDAPVAATTLVEAPPARRRPVAAAALLGIAAIALCLLFWRLVPASRTASRSIVVLPFAGTGADPSDGYFASGIHDMVLTRLTGVAGLRVIARASSEQLPSRPDDIPAVARQLGVAHVMEGTVQRDDKQVDVDVRLFDAASGTAVWTQRYTRPLTDVYRIEADIASQVAAVLDGRIGSAEADRLARAPTTDPRAYDAFLRAAYLGAKVEQGSDNSLASFERAVAEYRRAIELDPQFALAKARLAFLLVYGRWFGLATEPGSLAEAERLAREALGSDLPQAHLAMGYVLYWGRRDYAAALTKFEQARALLPGDAAVHGAIAFIRRKQGHLEDALQGLQQAQSLDPRNPLWFAERGNTFVHLRRYAEAQQEYGRALAVDPQGHRVVAYKAAAHVLAGELAQAHAALKEAPAIEDSTGLLAAVRFRLAWLERDGDGALAIADAQREDWIEEPFMASVPLSLLRARAYALKGQETQARDAFAKARDMAQVTLTEHPNALYQLSVIGMANAGLGRYDEAVRWAQRANDALSMEDSGFNSAPYRVALAQIFAQSGNASAAVEVVRSLLGEPSGDVLSPALLRIDPAWDPIRNDPAFKALADADAAASATAGAKSVAEVH